MYLEIDICPMIESAKRKWGSLEDDEREALNYAFTNAIMHVERVAKHRQYPVRLRRGVVHIHWFRIGHAVLRSRCSETTCRSSSIWHGSLNVTGGGTARRLQF
jgi:hypothetical protein